MPMRFATITESTSEPLTENLCRQCPALFDAPPDSPVCPKCGAQPPYVVPIGATLDSVLTGLMEDLDSEDNEV
ncbi:hypothetical protein [Nitrospira sp. BLG_1]|uniref:hypothetical protein n=1 Tax=Nitrospira sp. BLG_1 TaxID=3395883 RepID=UPI0039BCFEE2